MIAVAYSDLNLRFSRNFFDDYLIFFESIRFYMAWDVGYLSVRSG